MDVGAGLARARRTALDAVIVRKSGYASGGGIVLQGLLYLALLTACGAGKAADTVETDTCPLPADASQCEPTWGDHCSCEPQCMTRCEIDQITEFCDLGCADSGDGWTCQIDARGACAVAP